MPQYYTMETIRCLSSDRQEIVLSCITFVKKLIELVRNFSRDCDELKDYLYGQKTEVAKDYLRKCIKHTCDLHDLIDNPILKNGLSLLDSFDYCFECNESSPFAVLDKCNKVAGMIEQLSCLLLKKGQERDGTENIKINLIELKKQMQLQGINDKTVEVGKDGFKLVLLATLICVKYADELSGSCQEIVNLMQNNSHQTYKLSLSHLLAECGPMVNYWGAYRNLIQCLEENMRSLENLSKVETLSEVEDSLRPGKINDAREALEACHVHMDRLLFPDAVMLPIGHEFGIEMCNILYDWSYRKVFIKQVANLLSQYPKTRFTKTHFKNYQINLNEERSKQGHIQLCLYNQSSNKQEPIINYFDTCRFGEIANTIISNEESLFDELRKQLNIKDIEITRTSSNTITVIGVACFMILCALRGQALKILYDQKSKLKELINTTSSEQHHQRETKVWQDFYQSQHSVLLSRRLNDVNSAVSCDWDAEIEQMCSVINSVSQWQTLAGITALLERLSKITEAWKACTEYLQKSEKRLEQDDGEDLKFVLSILRDESNRKEFISRLTSLLSKDQHTDFKRIACSTLLLEIKEINLAVTIMGKTKDYFSSCRYREAIYTAQCVLKDNDQVQSLIKKMLRKVIVEHKALPGNDLYSIAYKIIDIALQTEMIDILCMQEGNLKKLLNSTLEEVGERLTSYQERGHHDKHAQLLFKELYQATQPYLKEARQETVWDSYYYTLIEQTLNINTAAENISLKQSKQRSQSKREQKPVVSDRRDSSVQELVNHESDCSAVPIVSDIQGALDNITTDLSKWVAIYKESYCEKDKFEQKLFSQSGNILSARVFLIKLIKKLNGQVSVEPLLESNTIDEQLKLLQPILEKLEDQKVKENMQQGILNYHGQLKIVEEIIKECDEQVNSLSKPLDKLLKQELSNLPLGQGKLSIVYKKYEQYQKQYNDLHTRTNGLNRLLSDLCYPSQVVKNIVTMMDCFDLERLRKKDSTQTILESDSNADASVQRTIEKGNLQSNLNRLPTISEQESGITSEDKEEASEEFRVRYVKAQGKIQTIITKAQKTIYALLIVPYVCRYQDKCTFTEVLSTKWRQYYLASIDNICAHVRGYGEVKNYDALHCYDKILLSGLRLQRETAEHYMDLTVGLAKIDHPFVNRIAMDKDKEACEEWSIAVGNQLLMLSDYLISLDQPRQLTNEEYRERYETNIQQWIQRWCQGCCHHAQEFIENRQSYWKEDSALLPELARKSLSFWNTYSNTYSDQSMQINQTVDCVNPLLTTPVVLCPSLFFATTPVQAPVLPQQLFFAQDLAVPHSLPCP